MGTRLRQHLTACRYNCLHLPGQVTGQAEVALAVGGSQRQRQLLWCSHNFNNSFTASGILPELRRLQTLYLCNQLAPHALGALGASKPEHHVKVLRSGSIISQQLYQIMYLGTTDIRGQFMSGRILSPINSVEYPGSMASLRCCKIFFESESGQSWRTQCKV